MSNHTEIEETFDSSDKLTQVQFNMDSDAMRRDGQLLDSSEYSDEKFFGMMERRMIEAKSETSSIELSLTYRGVSTGKKMKLEITRKEDGSFHYDYQNRFAWMQGFDEDKLALIKARYESDDKFREIYLRETREIFWKNMPSYFLPD